jgi:uncharacterized protein YdeI (YjbR/CyaY-like superfamily)
MANEVELFLKNTKAWKVEIEELRAIILKTGLEESFKWQKPCYCEGEANIVIIQPFKACLGLMFFKGTLLKDKEGVLVENGPNSQASKRMEFTSVQDIKKHAAIIKAYIKEAVAIEESGQKIEFKKKDYEIPEELKKTFSKHPKLKKSFEALTPGRQRAYLLHFTEAKKSETRQARIDKHTARILAGKGLAD